MLWHQQDQLLLSWLLSPTFEGVLTQVISYSKVWFTLEKLFTSQSKARVLQLCIQLQSINQEKLINDGRIFCKGKKSCWQSYKWTYTLCHLQTILINHEAHHKQCHRSYGWINNISSIARDSSYLDTCGTLMVPILLKCFI